MAENISGTYIDYVNGTLIYYKAVVDSKGNMTLYKLDNPERQNNNPQSKND
jgi:hypothetical protein